MTRSDFVGSAVVLDCEPGRSDKVNKFASRANEDVVDHVVRWADLLVAVVPRQFCQLKQIQGSCRLILAKDRLYASTPTSPSPATADTDQLLRTWPV